jgi:hypothetical protein
MILMICWFLHAYSNIIKEMIDKYFKKRFKTSSGVKLAIAIKRPYDWIRLKLRGEKILSQRYTFLNHGSIVKIKDSNGNILNPDGYTITNIIWTQSMIDDINEMQSLDAVAKIESELIKNFSNLNKKNKNDRG